MTQAPDNIPIAHLIEAVQTGDIERVRTMLNARPELAVMATSYGDERCAIHYDVIHRHPEIVRLLMQHGANARAGVHPHRDATSARTLAHERDYTEIVSIIEEEEARRPKPHSRESGPSLEPDPEPVHLAIANGDLTSLRTLLSEGKLINHVHWNHGGLLTLAVRNNQLDVLRFLLDECRFDPNEQTSYRHGSGVNHSQGYPLWHAAALGNREMANLLLDRGADPNVQVDSSGSSVYSAHSHKQWAMVDLLRSRGGIVTADTAACYRQTDLVRQMLLDYDNGTLHENVTMTEHPLPEEFLGFAPARAPPKSSACP